MSGDAVKVTVGASETSADVGMSTGSRLQQRPTGLARSFVEHPLYRRPVAQTRSTARHRLTATH